jgi:SagB-type dehydrogenase family enzyme
VSDTPQNSLPAYHARTKHRFDAYAEGPGQLDWDAQPAAFRHYPGAPVLELPLAADRFDRPYGTLAEPPTSPVGVDLTSLGALLELSLAISAWKSWGPNRWALRCNPSSGNLHPVEAYVLAGGLPGIADGLHHYEAEQHALEGRALTAPTGEAPWLAVALSSVMWREAWKYGERAFRYCQLDVGHAVGALSYAAALLGWQVRPLAVPGDTLGRLLGLDRVDDFPPSRYAFTETEEAEILLTIRAPGLQPMPAPAALLDRLAQGTWHGQPSRIDPSPGYRWPLVDQAAAASRQPVAVAASSAAAWPDWPPLPAHPAMASAAQLIRQRRSAQRFNPQCSLPQAAFYRLLDAALPRRQAPFIAQEAAPHIALLLFVLRVDGLPSGLYLLPRTPAAADELPAALAQRFAKQVPVASGNADCPAHLGLIRLAELGLPELQRLARALSCHQDIAATSAFSLGMLGDFSAIVGDGHGYRELLREAGLIGQVLYLEAEAAGVRGTGIGCFFDDPVHETFGLTGSRWQSVYHFTVGTPVDDARIETGPAYPQRQKVPS